MSQFSLSQLSAFTLEQSDILLQKAVLGADLVDYIDVRPGYPEATVSINVLGGTASFVDSSCGWTGAGTTNFTQIDITNSGKSWKQSLCLNDLRSYWMSSQLDSSAYGTSLPMEQAISDMIVKETRKAAEAVIGTSIIAQVTSTLGASLAATAAAFTSSNAYAMANALIDALPLAVSAEEDLMMLMSHASFRALMVNLVSNNYFHYNPGTTQGTGQGQSVIIPGTNIKAIPVGGFGTSSRVICGPAKHIIMVCGLIEDTDRIEAWWSQDHQEMRMLAKFTNGVGVLAESFSTNDQS